ncbi:restriction endonuclease subunit S [Pelotomaculum propionicicum]|uniref:Type I restriction modification DNA specificity domain-containing protein n=1 Tax=Pelotomaculum propionicicum TaxID=258475 RepID=A0A4Y7RXG2_9FIRM|nr:restriction endonuclease subunit S [Pelotomaculum propionicicum]TEB13450.1 hypothetical protein Pmgp_00344 [Pelotomaculum propionicicum]
MSVAKLSYDYNDYSFPEDWEEYRLSQLLEVVERPVDLTDDQEYDLITIKRNFGGIESRGKLAGERILVKSQFEIREGDFIISKRQIVHGACAVVSKKHEGATVSNEYDVMNCNNRVLPSFFDYYVQLPFMRRFFYIASDGVHIEKLRFKTRDWLRQKVRVPSIIEQQKIVKVLSTWNRAIELEERLISEKKQQKKWLMQNLLTGKKRLPGFTEGWQDIRLGDICKNVLGGGTPARNVKGYYKGNIPWVTVKDLDGAKQKYDSIEHISLDAIRQSASKIIPKGNLIVSTRMGLGRGFINMVDMAINQDMKGIILNSTSVSTEFIFYCFIELGNYLERLGNGSTVKGVDLSTLLNLIINLPPLPEQTAIAEILSTADREIDLHEKQLEELKKQKKALMQLLLTGIVRVNAQEVS